jgi:hypothetical protein
VATGRHRGNKPHLIQPYILIDMDKPIIYKGHEWRGRIGTGYVCEECGAICSKAEEMTLTECRPRLAPVEWFGAHLQIRWNKTDDPEWPLEVVYKLFKQCETKELERLLAKESYPKLAPCRTITGEKYAQMPAVWKKRIRADAETMALPVYVVDIDGDPIKWSAK